MVQGRQLERGCQKEGRRRQGFRPSQVQAQEEEGHRHGGDHP